MRNLIQGLVLGALVAWGPAVAMAQGGPYGDPYADDAYARAPQQYFSGDVSLLLGAKTLDSYWDSVDPAIQDQGEFAILFDVKGPYWPVSFAVDWRASVGDTYFDGVGYTYTRTRELNLGVRHVMEPGGAFRPYIGGGIALITMEFVDDYSGSTYADGSATGLWFGVGAYFDMSPHLHLGLDLAWSDADADVGLGVSEPIGGQHVGLTLGYHWR